MKHSDLRRAGLIVPSGNMALEWEFHRHLPEGYTVNCSRVVRSESALLTKESLLAMTAGIAAAARALVRTRPEIVLYGCTSGSFINGFGNEAEGAELIAGETGIPAVTTSTAVLEALAALKARTVFMVTPYPEEINRHEAGFLGHHGHALTGCDSFRCDENRTIGSIDSEETAALVLKNREAASSADAVFISCTNLLTFDQIERLEAALGVPVVSSNLASFWAVARHAGWPVRGPGRLFETAPNIGNA